MHSLWHHRGLRWQHLPPKQPGPWKSTWIKAATQTMGIHIAFTGNTSHRPWLWSVFISRHGPQWQHRPGHHYGLRCQWRPLRRIGNDYPAGKLWVMNWICGYKTCPTFSHTTDRCLSYWWLTCGIEGFMVQTVINLLILLFPQLNRWNWLFWFIYYS